MIRLFTIAIIITSLLIPHRENAKIAFIGDSYTLGSWDEIPDNGYGYAGHVANQYGFDYYRFLFMRYPAALDRFWQVKNYNPDIIVIELGIHTVTYDDPIQTESGFRWHVGRLLDLSLAEAGQVVIMEIPWRGPWVLGTENRAKALNQIIIEEATKRGVPVAYVYEAMRQCGAACVGSDGSHPNDAGHQILANAVIEALTPQYASGYTLAYFPIIEK